MEESEEQNEHLPQDERLLRQQRFAKQSDELESLGISLEHAADVIGRRGGHFRNAKTGKAVLSVKTLDLVDLYIKFEKDIREYFIKRTQKEKNKGENENKGEDESQEVPLPQINEKNLKYNPLQEEILAVAEKNFAYTMAFAEYQVEIDSNGNKELKNKRLADIKQDAENRLATLHRHKNAPNKQYPKTSKGKPTEDNPQPPAPPEEPTP